jgi:hypothetical protein
VANAERLRAEAEGESIEEAPPPPKAKALEKPAVKKPSLN